MHVYEFAMCVCVRVLVREHVYVCVRQKEIPVDLMQHLRTL